MGRRLDRVLAWCAARPGSLGARALLRGYAIAKPPYKTVSGWFWRRAFRRNLCLLHDVLAATPLTEKYWLCGGLLLGWAREGRLLRHDWDADFGYLHSDRALLLQAIPAIIAAGFRPRHRWTNNAGEVTEYVFFKEGARFEFFEFRRSGGALVSWMYTSDEELFCSMPAHGLAPMPFLERTWQKPDDHERYLTAVYGDWRVRAPDYHYARDQQDICERRPRRGSNVWPPGVDGA